jgi:hypothetical protein
MTFARLDYLRTTQGSTVGGSGVGAPMGVAPDCSQRIMPGFYPSKRRSASISRWLSRNDLHAAV